MIRKVRFRRDVLNTGTLTAHKGIRLVLLHSWPDTVHGALLRKTRVSTHHAGLLPHKITLYRISPLL